SCAPRVLFVRDACKPPPFVGTITDAFHLWRTAGRVTPLPTRAYQDLDGGTGWTCAVGNGSIDTSFAAYQSGDEVTASLAKLDAARKDGARLDAWLWVSDDYRQLDHLHDRTLDVDCAPTRLADGSDRCLPDLPEVATDTSYFADATCVTPL